MKFYKENNINPAASCLPILFQFPIFIALYFVLQATSTKHVNAAQERARLAAHRPEHHRRRSPSHWSGYVLLVVYVVSQVVVRATSRRRRPSAASGSC